MRGRYADFQHTFCPHTPVASPTMNIPHQNDPLTTSDEPTLACHNHPKPIVHITIHSWCRALCGR